MRTLSVKVAIGGAALVAVALVLAPTYDLPGQRSTLRRMTAPAVAEGVQIAQTFEMSAPSLDGITISPIRVASPSGRIELRLVDLGDGRVVRQQQVEATDVLRDAAFHWTFAPILTSKRREYRVDLAAVPPTPTTGVGLRASRGEGYSRGEMLVNGAERWADLVFRADAPNPPLWRLIAGATTPFGAPAALVLVPAFLMLWACLAVALGALAAPASPAAIDLWEK